MKHLKYRIIFWKKFVEISREDSLGGVSAWHSILNISVTHDCVPLRTYAPPVLGSVLLKWLSNYGTPCRKVGGNEGQLQ